MPTVWRTLVPLVVISTVTACIGVPSIGGEGQNCFEDKTCLADLACGSDNVCAKPGQLTDAGEQDEGGTHQDGGASDGASPPDGGVDAGTDGEFDAGVDGGVDSGVDAGADTGEADGGCTPSCAGKCNGESDGCGGTCADPCNGHGTCASGVCTCTTGYAVPSCNTCAAGYAGYPTCTPFTITCGPSPTGKGGEMCLVPSWAFMMGCNAAVDTECQSNENPYHQVTVPAFKIDKYEVTASEYKACVTASACTTANTTSGCNYNVSGKESHPINCVDWSQSKAYCAWAGKRLPSEVEWEKAARGTDGRKYPWGNAVLDCNRVVHSVSPCSISGTAVVGSKPTGVSPYGVEDMIGNVWELAEDDWHGTYTSAPADGSAWIDTPRGASRVMRGGSWDASPTYYLRASFRVYAGPSYGHHDVGFRCAMSQ